MFTEAGDRLESLLALHGQIGSSHFELPEFPNACQFNGRLTRGEGLVNHIADGLSNDVDVLPALKFKMLIFRKIQPLQNRQVRLKDESSDGRVRVISRVGSEMHCGNYVKKNTRAGAAVDQDLFTPPRL